MPCCPRCCSTFCATGIASAGRRAGENFGANLVRGLHKEGLRAAAGRRLGGFDVARFNEGVEHLLGQALVRKTHAERGGGKPRDFIGGLWGSGVTRLVSSAIWAAAWQARVSWRVVIGQIGF
jgi:hypothetical protein